VWVKKGVSHQNLTIVTRLAEAKPEKELGAIESTSDRIVKELLADAFFSVERPLASS
jgi:hypothetical protein